MYEVDCYDGGSLAYTVDTAEKPAVGDLVDGARVIKVRSSDDESQTVQVEIDYE